MRNGGHPHLELPLGGHHLRVGAADSDPGVQAGAVVSLNNVASVNLNITSSTCYNFVHDFGI